MLRFAFSGWLVDNRVRHSCTMTQTSARHKMSQHCWCRVALRPQAFDCWNVETIIAAFGTMNRYSITLSAYVTAGEKCKPNVFLIDILSLQSLVPLWPQVMGRAAAAAAAGTGPT